MPRALAFLVVVVTMFKRAQQFKDRKRERAETEQEETEGVQLLSQIESSKGARLIFECLLCKEEFKTEDEVEEHMKTPDHIEKETAFDAGTLSTNTASSNKPQSQKKKKQLIERKQKRRERLKAARKARSVTVTD